MMTEKPTTDQQQPPPSGPQIVEAAERVVRKFYLHESFSDEMDGLAAKLDKLGDQGGCVVVLDRDECLELKKLLAWMPLNYPFASSDGARSAGLLASIERKMDAILSRVTQKGEG